MTYSVKFWLIFNWIFLRVKIYNIPGLAQIMAWRRPGKKPLSEPIMVSLLTHICITQPQWVNWVTPHNIVNRLRPRQNGRHFADDIFKCSFFNENLWIPIKISLKFVPRGPINNNPALVKIMAWRQPGDKPLSEPMMVSLLTHICVTRPQWVNCITIRPRHLIVPICQVLHSCIKLLHHPFALTYLW